MSPSILDTQMKLFMSTLNEKQKRLFAGLEANRIGHGGQKIVAELLEMDPQTVRRGQRELEQVNIIPGVIRQSGGGRKRVEKKT
jgi:hypothetical protein